MAIGVCCGHRSDGHMDMDPTRCVSIFMHPSTIGNDALKTIATLTMNPTIDGACEAERVFHTHKIRTSRDRYDPDGGGINVARVLHRLGAQRVLITEVFLPAIARLK